MEIIDPPPPRKFEDPPSLMVRSMSNAGYLEENNLIILNWHHTFKSFIDNDSYLSDVLSHETVHWILTRDFGPLTSRGYDYFFGNTPLIITPDKNKHRRWVWTHLKKLYKNSRTWR